MEVYADKINNYGRVFGRHGEFGKSLKGLVRIPKENGLLVCVMSLRGVRYVGLDGFRCIRMRFKSGFMLTRR